MVPGEVPVMEGESKGGSPELRVGDLAITTHDWAGTKADAPHLGAGVVVEIIEIPSNPEGCYGVYPFLMARNDNRKWWVAKDWIKLWWRSGADPE